jgi:hypothetical protein
MVAAKIATMRQGEHKTGQLAGLHTQGQAADMLNVGKRSVRRAREILDAGAPNIRCRHRAGRGFGQRRLLRGKQDEGLPIQIAALQPPPKR